MKVVRVNKVKPVSQTDYLRLLGEALVQANSQPTTTADERRALQHELHKLIYNRPLTTGGKE